LTWAYKAEKLSRIWHGPDPDKGRDAAPKARKGIARLKTGPLALAEHQREVIDENGTL
jgi:hypothetical protein